jgi:glycosyltransferase involved in cell wall biosynthesis
VSRILLVHQPIDGGVGRHVLDLFEGLTELGYEALLCGPAVPSGSLLAGAEPPASSRNGSTSATDRHLPLAMRRAIAPRADVAGLARYAGIVRSVKPDLVHAHSSKAGAIARLGKLLQPRMPVLYTPHGYAFAGFFEHELERVAYRETERALGPLTRRVVAVCQAEARLAASVCPARRVRVVYNGIEPGDGGPPDERVRALASRGPIVCAVTQLRPGKGVETLVDALPAVIARHPDVQLVIVGDGPLRTALQTQADKHGVGAGLHFLGEHANPGAVLRASDVFVMPSWAESFPYVILEAMSESLPILATDVGGIAEAIVDGESGLLAAPRDDVALARGLVALLDDPDMRARLAGTARAEVRQRFTRAGMIARLADVYEEVLSEVPRR